MRRIRIPPPVPALALAAAAALQGLSCRDAPDTDSPRRGTIADSAGITVVRNGVVPAWGPEEAWWVEERLRIGGEGSWPGSLAGWVADVAVDAEGRIYALDPRAQGVLVFGAGGEYLRTLGGPGEGPGELGKPLTSVMVRNGEIWVPDGAHARVNRWRPDGTPLSSFSIPPEAATRSWWAAAPDGEVYFRALTTSAATGVGGDANDRLYRLTDPLGAEPVVDFGVSRVRPAPPGELPPRAVVNAPAWAVLPDGSVAWTTLETSEIRVRRPDGSQIRIRSDAWLPHAPSEGERTLLARLVAERLRMLGGSEEEAGGFPVEFPASLPVLTDLHAGPEGTIWVQRPGPLWEVHPLALGTEDPPRGWGGSTWEVLSREGVYLGTLELPPRFRVMRVGEDAVIGVESDPRRVDRIVVLALRRPAHAP